jgi:peptidoglycan/xylan/chitin deacetylase (PgdA/CDA1 family)
MRYDRLITLHTPIPALFGSRNESVARLPILMYHSVSDYKKSYVGKYYETTTTPQSFSRQMQWLVQNGFKTKKLLDSSDPKFIDADCGNDKSVIITFDDGLQDFLENAFPILFRANFLATVYLVTGWVRKQSGRYNGKKYLTWTQVRELKKVGIEFGSHTVSHPQLWKLSKKEIHKEVLVSKQTIEDQLGSRIELFSYPYAFPEMDTDFVECLRRTLAECGYRNCVTTMVGTEDASLEKFFLRRLPINEHDDPSLFVGKVTGKYDWVHAVQYLKKRFVGIKTA